LSKGFEMVDKSNHLIHYFAKTGFKVVDKAGNVLKDIEPHITKNEYIQQVAEKLNMSTKDFTTHLWNTYHPNQILWIFVGIGIVTFLALVFYDKVFVKRLDRKAND